MKESVKKNFIYNALFQILTILIPLITTPYVSRVLGAVNIGIYSYATSVVTYFVVVATLGSTVFGQRSIAFFRDDREKMSEVFWNVFSFRAISGMVFTILYFVYLLVIDELSIVYIIVALNVVNVIADVSWFYQGIEAFKKTIIRNCVVKVASLLLIFVFVKTVDDTWVYALIFCASFILGNLVLWISLPNYISKPKRIRPFCEIKEMFLIFVPTIASQVYTILDKSMIGWIVGTGYQNGCYEQSERIARAALTVVTAVGAVILPRVANLYKNNELELAKEYIYKGYKVVWSIGLPITFGLISTAPILIPLYLGGGFDMSVPLLQIFSLLVIFVSLAYVTGLSYLTPTNQQNIYSISVIAAAILNFIMNLVLIPVCGAIGAAWASIAAELLGVVIQIGYCVEKKQLSLRRIVIPAWKYCVSGLVMLICIFLTQFVLPNNLLSLIVMVIGGGIIYFVLLIILREDFILPTVINGIKNLNVFNKNDI